mmetsp:Transcript_21185/g.47309  ORF Transcript_21185/g.47309 Transcript_21185/m.47309 type:complete len:80 (-) Transcript_21185:948-1187(-)
MQTKFPHSISQRRDTMGITAHPTKRAAAVTKRVELEVDMVSTSPSSPPASLVAGVTRSGFSERRAHRLSSPQYMPSQQL